MKAAAANQIDSDRRASKAPQLGIVQNANGQLQQQAPPPPPPPPQPQNILNGLRDWAFLFFVRHPKQPGPRARDRRFRFLHFAFGGPRPGLRSHTQNGKSPALRGGMRPGLSLSGIARARDFPPETENVPPRGTRPGPPLIIRY